MYGCENVEDVYKFIQGYSIALDEHNIENLDSDAKKFSAFNDFVLAHYNLKSSHHNWSGVIRYNSSVGGESFENFFKLFNEFVQKT